METIRILIYVLPHTSGNKKKWNLGTKEQKHKLLWGRGVGGDFLIKLTGVIVGKFERDP